MKLRIGHKYGTNKARSIDSEKDLAAKLGGKVQPASGAINRFDLKGDVKSDLFLCDDKVCGGKSFSVTLKLWKTLSKQAWMNDKRPLLRMNFNDGEPVYLIDEVTFLQLLRAFQETHTTPGVQPSSRRKKT